MNTLQINRALQNVKCYGGAFCRDQLPKINKLPCVLISNTDPCSKPGQHWVAMHLKANGSGEYFDSYGFPPIHEDLINFLNFNSPSGWSFNKHVYQAMDSDVCGLYCILYTRQKCYLRPFRNLFTRDSYMND